MTEEASIYEDEATPATGVADWAASIHLAKIEEIVRTLSTGQWSILPDPDTQGSFYISTGTEVVAEGLSLQNASAIMYLINELPEALEYFEDLARMWDVLNDGVLETQGGELATYLEIIGKYQMHIAQLEANPAPIPEAATAGELSYMHVGHLLRFSESEADGLLEPIISVSQTSESLTRVTVGAGNNIVLYLPKDAPVEVVVIGAMAGIAPPDEEGPVEDENSPSDSDTED